MSDFPSFFFLVRHFLLFKGNKASLIHNNFYLFFFFSGIGVFRENARLCM